MESALVVAEDQKERPLKLAERKTLPHNKPAFWSSKIHGIPANYKPKEHVQHKARPGQTAPAVERRTTAIRAKAKEAGKLVPRSQASVRLVNSVTAELKRKVIQDYTPFHEKESTILMRTFELFDHDRSGVVSVEAFQKVLACFEIEADETTCHAVFQKFGCNQLGQLPYDVFTRTLFTSANRLLAWTSIKQGVPFQDSSQAIQQRAENEFRGKIQTGRFKCLTGLYTPSDWDSRAVLERARRRPDAHLELDFVYGYAGNTKFLIEKGQRIDPQSSFVSPNLFYTSTREVAYFTAATGIVLKWEDSKEGGPAKAQAAGAVAEERESAPPQAGRKRQRFFTSHDNDILCLALDASRNYAATGQAAPLKVAKGVQSTPTVSVWDVHSMQAPSPLSTAPPAPRCSPGHGRPREWMPALCTAMSTGACHAGAHNVKGRADRLDRGRAGGLLLGRRAARHLGVPQHAPLALRLGVEDA